MAVFSPTLVFADINLQVNYQGRLTDSAGVAVPDGSYNMEFKLYTQATGGSLLGTETWTGINRVPVVDGYFSLMLGSVGSLADIDFNQTLYLGVNVGGTAETPVWDGEMTPRKILGAVPAAFEARKLGGLLPSSFLRADVANDYATITNATTSNLYTTLLDATAGFFTSLIVETLSVADSLLVSGNATTTGYLSIGSAPFGAHFTDGSLNIQNFLTVPSASTTDLTVTGTTYLNGTLTGSAFTTAFDNRLSTIWRGQPNGLASLGADGKVPDEQLSPLAISDTFVVSSEAEMLALSSAQIGDVAIRTDANKSYILRDSDPSLFASWAELLAPTDSVISVNGHRGAVTLSTDDIDEGLTNLYFTNTRMDDRINSVWRGQPNGLASLGADGKVPTAQLGALPINNTFVVASEAEMLATGASKGDIAVRTDESKTYILQGEDPTDIGDWVEIAGTATVISVNGYSGIVTLTTSDIAEGSGLYWTQNRFDTALVNATTWDGDLFVDGGNVGIGISDPSQALEVLGNASTSHHFYVGKSLYVGQANGTDSDVIYFRTGAQSLAWNATNNRFEVSTALFAPLTYASSSMIDSLSLGGGLTATLLSTNDQGQVVATSSDTLIANYLIASTTLPSLLSHFTKNDDDSLTYTGSLGLGTTSPYAKLSVVGEVVASHFTATTTATSTFGGGIEITSGCFAVNGVCLTAGVVGDSLWSPSGNDIYFNDNVAIGASDFGGRLTVTQVDNTSSGGISLRTTGIEVYDWTEQTAAGSRVWYGLASSADGIKLAAAVGLNGYIYTSTTSGETWTEQTAAGERNWNGLASSADGTKLAAVSNGLFNKGYIYTSTTSGETWTEQTTAGSRDWQDIASSDDGTKLAATVDGGYIYTSTTSGETWTAQTTAGSRNWSSITSSADGTKLAATVSNGYIYTSTTSGETWTAQTTAGSRVWRGVASSDDGAKLAAVVDDGYIYTSTTSGETWTEQTTAGSRDWYGLASSADGTKLVAVAYDSYIYISTDSGTTWTAQISAGSRNWSSITSSADGTKLAVANVGYIYTYGPIEESSARSFFLDDTDNFRLSGTSLDYLTITNTGSIGFG
ncbi:MAG: hypothetical protein WC905_03625, partial [Patescibacteria group bacterium]